MGRSATEPWWKINHLQASFSDNSLLAVTYFYFLVVRVSFEIEFFHIVSCAFHFSHSTTSVEKGGLLDGRINHS